MRNRQASATGPGVLRVPRQRGLAVPGLCEQLEAGDRACCDRLDRSGRDEVGADAAGAEIARQVAVDGLQGGLRDAHPVICRPGDGRVEVQADDRRVLALLQQRQHRGRETLHRVRARRERDLRGLGGRAEEIAAERVAGGERDRVQDAVQRTPARLEIRRDGRELVGVVDVELEHVGRRVAEPLGDPLRDAQPAAEAGQDDLSALLLRAAGDGVGDRALGEDSGDEQATAVEKHRRTLPTVCWRRRGRKGAPRVLRTSSWAPPSVRRPSQRVRRTRRLAAEAHEVRELRPRRRGAPAGLLGGVAEAIHPAWLPGPPARERDEQAGEREQPDEDREREDRERRAVSRWRSCARRC